MKIIYLSLIFLSTALSAAPKHYACSLSVETDRYTGGGPGRPSLAYDKVEVFTELKALHDSHAKQLVKQEVTEDLVYATAKLEMFEGSACAISLGRGCSEGPLLQPTHKFEVTLTDKHSGQVFKLKSGSDASHPLMSLNFESRLPLLTYTPTYEAHDGEGSKINSFELDCGEVFY